MTGSVLRNVTINVDAGQGPCLAGAYLFQQGGNQTGVGLGPRKWIRSPSLGGQTGDFYGWQGSAAFIKNAVIRIYVRNDSGAEVTWFAQWVTDVGEEQPDVFDEQGMRRSLRDFLVGR